MRRLLVAIVKKELRLDRSLNEILQILSITLFEKVHISQALTEMIPQNEKNGRCNQLTLFDF
jgi:hypothetical protein